MSQVKGQPVETADSASRKYLLDKLSETRKSCEWLVTLGAANVFANLLKVPPSHQWLRRPSFILVALQMLLALIGALTWLARDVDAAFVEQRLRKTLEWRYRIRNTSLLRLVITFGLLLFQYW